MSPELLADVAIRASIPGANPVFTYRVPAQLRPYVRRGQLVWVPLRRQRVQGIVLDLYAAEIAGGDTGEVDDASESAWRARGPAPMRDLADVADPDAALTPAQLRLARWLSDYYRVPLYEALALMLPPGVSQEAETTWRATSAGLAVDLGGLPEAERAVLYFLRQQGETSERDLRRVLRGSDSELRATYRALQERGLLVRGAVLSRPRARPRVERLARLLVPPAEIDITIASLSRAPKQQAVVSFLAAHNQAADQALAAENHREGQANGTAEARPYPLTALYGATGVSLAAIQALERRGLVELTTREVRRDPLAGDDVLPDVPPPLSHAQEQAWRLIATATDKITRPHDQPAEESSKQSLGVSGAMFLLHGVTGSGKTEIYLRAIGRALRRGRQALVLVPEIALTAQLVRRFAARFPGQLAVLHSGLSLGERYDEWRRLRSGAARLAIGSRSAVFAPLPQLGLIIVDEEHESSYKHDASPRYHARDVALQLAALSESVLILGSATPAVESYAAAQAGRLTLVRMAERVGMAYDERGLPRPRALPLPPVRIVDMRRELQEGNRSIFSLPLQAALRQALDRGEQAILFLNRRGAASSVICRDCGHAIACPNCSTPLAVHYDESEAADGMASVSQGNPSPQVSMLVCHSCNYRALIPVHCPECWSTRVRSFGVGTQRVVEEVEALFPGARPLRWDRDSVGRKGEHTRMLDRFLAHEADVLVGTQMIAKGLDLPLVSVVGVVAADTALTLPDFRAGERTFQLLTQVAGRAGRRGADAQVVIQTYSPEHYALLAAQEHDYGAFYTQEIAFRRQLGYPPFARLVRFVYTSGSDERCRKAAEALLNDLQILATALDLGDWSVIGPAPAFFQRRRNRYRWHVLLRCPEPAPLLNALRLPTGWSVDIDPVNVL